jgi:predicted RNA-binding Zn ribbon-like protein
MTAHRHSAGTVLVPAPRDDLCLGYANTRFWRGRPAPTETIGGFADLMSWAAGALGFDPEALRRTADRARRHPAEAEKLLAEAIVLREAIYRIFAALAGGEDVAETDLDALDRALAAAPARRAIARAERGFAWRVDGVPNSATALLAPVLWSAADLMLKGERADIRRCANEECLWLFVDRSKTATRRWCDMTSCGNRAKARRHYLKTKDR